MSRSMSNSDLLLNEKQAFSNVKLPLERENDLAGGELPFIVGVVDDFSGNAPRKDRGHLTERTFDKVSRYTLDQKVAEFAPGLEYDVPSHLPESIHPKDTPLHVSLSFNEMKDFEPKRV